MEISITAFNKAERRLEMVLTGAPQPPEAFAVVHGDTTIARSMAVGPGQTIDGAVSIACEILADIATEMVLPAFSTARYEAQFAGGDDRSVPDHRERRVARTTVANACCVDKKRFNPGKRRLHFFFRNGANRLIDQHQGLLRLTPEAEQQWLANLEFRAVVGRDLGVPLLTVAIPNKETVYQDLIPDFPISDQRPVRRLMAMTEAAGLSHAFITLEDGLCQLAREHDAPLYDRTTAYWNGLGACLAFNLLAPRLSGLLSADIPAYDLSELYYAPR